MGSWKKKSANPRMELALEVVPLVNRTRLLVGVKSGPRRAGNSIKRLKRGLTVVSRMYGEWAVKEFRWRVNE